MLLNTSLSKNRITVGSKSFQTLENTGMFGSKTVTGNVMRNMRATTKAQRSQGCDLKFLKMTNPVHGVKIYSLKLDKSVDICPSLTFNLPKTVCVRHVTMATHECDECLSQTQRGADPQPVGLVSPTSVCAVPGGGRHHWVALDMFVKNEITRKVNYLLDKITSVKGCIKKIPYMIVMFRLLCANLWYVKSDYGFNNAVRNKLLQFNNRTGTNQKLISLMSCTFLHYLYPEELN
jgi:hypothetical protein